MIKVKYEYSGKTFEISPYNTAQEKELLLLSMISEPNIDNALEICGTSKEIIDSLSEFEKVALLYKYREISIGDDINLKFTCKHCGNGNENALNISNIVRSSNIKNELINDQFKEVTEDNFQDFISSDVEELDIDEYEDLLEETKQSCTTFDFRRPIICQKCTEKNYVRINKPEFVIDNLSEDSVMSLYQTYNDMTFFGKYTKQDVDTLYPFERTILISLLNKTREDLNK